MLNNLSLIRLIFFISFIFIYPLIQKQWFNLYLFNSYNFSFYSVLYFLSGIVTPLFVFINSSNIFTIYNFNKYTNIKKVSGKNLFLVVLIILIPLSFLLLNYFYLNFELILGLIYKKGILIKFKYLYQFYLTLLICILLIFRKTKIVIKKLTLYNYLIISLIIWYVQSNNIFISDKYLINKYLDFDNYNYINILYLFTIELLYFLWSLLSNKNNLSDWDVPLPKKIDILPITKITIFYFFIAVYYSLLD